MRALSMNLLSGLGGFVRQQWLDWQNVAGVLATTLYLSVQPRHWRRTVRHAFAHQLLASGLESVRFILIVSVLVGVSVVVQLAVWTGTVGQSHMLGWLHMMPEGYSGRFVAAAICAKQSRCRLSYRDTHYLFRNECAGYAHFQIR